MSRNLMDLFAAASEISGAGERAAFLDDACGGGAELRARLEKLLGAHEQVGGENGFLGGPEGPESGVMTGTGAEAEAAGGEVGRYKLLQKIGEGGWGIVYMADQTEPVRRRVALKIIRPGMDSRQVLARFEAERQALAMMDHPHIARVLDAGTTENGRPYFVMELVRGIRITDYCDRNRLTTAERLELFCHVCLAVQHAHQKGIIHRDIKPSNILVTSDDGKPLPKVIDFGVAKATTDMQLTDKTLFTRFEMFVGTPAYMSPEQAEFCAQGVDTRSDIYALGVLLYELLTGQTPFDGQTLISSGVDAMRRTIREEEPPKPSTRLRLLDGKTVETVAAQRKSEQGKLVAQIRGDLDWIVLKALEKDRTRRYETANGLALDVQRFLNSEPVSARSPSAFYTFCKWSRRHRAVFLGAASVLAVLVLGVIVSMWLAVRAMKAEGIQRELRAKSEVDRAAADAARNEAVIRAYAADMTAVSVALAEGNTGQANVLLDRYVPQKGQPDVRGFEWQMLRQRAAGDELASFEHPGIGCSTVIAPDNSWVASAVKFGSVRVWETAGGRLLQEFPALREREPRSCLAVSQDGSMLAYAGDKSVWVRGTAHWEVLREIPARANSVNFAPGGQLVWGAADGLHFFNAQTFAEERVLRCAPLARSTVVSFTSDGQTVCILTDNYVVELWNVTDGTLRARPQAGPLCMAVLSPDGRYVAVGTGSGMLRLWDVRTQMVVAETEAHASWLLAAAFSADSTRLVTGGGDQTLRLWDLTAAAPLATEAGQWRGHWNEIWSVGFSVDGERMISSGKDGRVNLWPARPPGRSVLEKNTGVMDFGGYSSDSRHFYLLAADRIEARRVEDGEPAGEWRFKSDYDLQFAAFHGDHVLFRDREGGAAMHHLPDGARERHIPCRERPAEHVAAVSPDRNTVVTIRRDGALDVWDFLTGNWLVTLPDFTASGGNATHRRVCFSPDGTRVAYTGTERRVFVFGLRERRMVHTLSGFGWHLYAVAWSPDGRWLATSGWDGLITVWDPVTGQRALPELRGHFAGVPGLSFTADSRTLISHGAERTIRCWNLPTGTEVLAFRDAEAPGSCPVSPDGRTFIHRSAGGDNVWRIERVN